MNQNSNFNKHLPIASLALMMFLQYWAMGSVFSTLGLVLGSHGMASVIGTTFTVGGFVSIFMPVLMGMVADRFLAAQKLLTLLNLVSAVSLLFEPSAVIHRNAIGFLIYTVIFYSTLVPATAIANRIAFNVLGTDHKRFTLIRTCGTLGFTAGTLVIGLAGLSASIATFYVASAAAACVAALGLFLPDTPAAGKGTAVRLSELLGVGALQLLKIPQYRVFLLGTVLLFVPMMAHISYLSLFLGVKQLPDVGALMAIGPFSELFFMMLLAFFLARWGFKWCFVLAATMWTVRMLMFSYASLHAATTLVIIGIVLHGVSWDFFFVTGEIYTNQLASESIKAQAQGLWRTITFGVGVTFGSLLTGQIFNRVVTVQGPAGLPLWQNFWLYSSIFAAASLIILVTAFRNPATERHSLHIAAAPLEFIEDR